MMTLIAKGENFRVFQDKLFGIKNYFILEDSTNATKSQGVDYNVTLTNYYWQTLPQMKILCNEMFEDNYKSGVWFK